MHYTGNEIILLELSEKHIANKGRETNVYEKCKKRNTPYDKDMEECNLHVNGRCNDHCLYSE